MLSFELVQECTPITFQHLFQQHSLDKSISSVSFVKVGKKMLFDFSHTDPFSKFLFFTLLHKTTK